MVHNKDFHYDLSNKSLDHLVVNIEYYNQLEHHTDSAQQLYDPQMDFTIVIIVIIHLNVLN